MRVDCVLICKKGQRASAGWGGVYVGWRRVLRTRELVPYKGKRCITAREVAYRRDVVYREGFIPKRVVVYRRERGAIRKREVVY